MQIKYNYEFFRRIVLVLCFSISIWIAFLVSTQPLLIISPLFSNEDIAKHMYFLSGESEEKYKNEENNICIIDVNSEQWKKIFSKVDQVFSKDVQNSIWKNRIGDYENNLYLYEKELPNLAEEQYFIEGKTYFIKLKLDETVKYLKINKKAYDNSDFYPGKIGGGAPIEIKYPYRKYSQCLFILGLLIYFFMPRAKTNNSLRYSLLWIVMLDICGLLWFSIFFSLPIIIIEGAIQTFSLYPVLSSMSWIISGLGLNLIKSAGEYASTQFIFNESYFSQIKNGEIEKIYYKDIDYIVVLKQGLFAAYINNDFLAISNIENMQNPKGLRIVLNCGSEINIKFNNFFGHNILINCDKAISQLSEFGVPMLIE